MTGTLVNVGAILLGSLVGLLLKKGIPQQINESITKAEGLAIMVIGLNGVIAAMFTVDPDTGRLADAGALLLLVCLVLGCLIGELLRLDDRLEGLGLWVERKMNARGFAKGFVTASLLFCIGAMSIVGPLNDGLRGDSSVLFVKSALDFTAAIILASSLGSGVIFAALPVLLCQGSVALLSRWIAPYLSDDLLGMICMVGFAIVLAIGINFVGNVKIKTANLLPALVLPVLYYFLFVGRLT